METDKVITYSAIGVAGIVCLIFLLDLAAGIFGRQSPWTFCSSWERRSCCGRGSRRFWSSAERAGMQPRATRGARRRSRACMPVAAFDRDAAIAAIRSTRASTKPSQVYSVASTATFQPRRSGGRRGDRAEARQADLAADPLRAPARVRGRAAAR